MNFINDEIKASFVNEVTFGNCLGDLRVGCEGNQPQNKRAKLSVIPSPPLGWIEDLQSKSTDHSQYLINYAYVIESL